MTGQIRRIAVGLVPLALFVASCTAESQSPIASASHASQALPSPSATPPASTTTAEPTATPMPLDLTWSADDLAAYVFSVGTLGDSILAVGRDRDGLAAWMSPDGVAWDRHAVGNPPFVEKMAVTFGPSVFDGTQMGPMADLDGTIFSIGTFFGPNDFYRPVGWRSTDGKSWEFIESQSAFYKTGSVTDLESFGIGLVAARSTGLAGANHSLWTWSPDSSWIQTSIRSAPGASLVRLDAAVAGNQVVVVGDLAKSDMIPILDASPMAWTSTDGADWHELQLPRGMRSACGVDATPTGGFAVLGTRPHGDAAVWTMGEGETWSRFDLGQGSCVRPDSLVSAGDWLVASVLTGDKGAKVWLSDDGRRWIRQDIPTVYSVDAAEVDGQLILLGTAPDDRPFHSVVLVGSP